uniref:Putative leucine-rich repeat receptor-like protein kinase At1g35710 isoform X2 n=1 Tax=Rhizophora mucronata TaxID=61149 RepID=A0A2P2NDB4_RHIMU
MVNRHIDEGIGPVNMLWLRSKRLNGLKCPRL